MSRWFTSDLHFGHENIIRFCNRPFDDVHHMNVEMCRSINERVGPEDELWILGDLALGNIQKTLPIVKRLTAGKVFLVAGNHDRCHPLHGKKSERWVDPYLEVFDGNVIFGNTSLALSNGSPVEVSHFPYLGDSYDWGRGVDRYLDHRPVDNGYWLLCGHVHDSWRQNERMINVGIDAWGGVPVSEEKLIQMISEGPQLLPKETWKLTRSDNGC